MYGWPLGVGAARAVRATIGSAYVDVHARMPEQDGCGAVPPDPRPSHLRGNLPCAPQRALRGVCARDTDRRALPRLVRSRGQEDAMARARRTPGPHACSNGTRRGSGVGEPRENQGERRPIPSPAPPTSSAREHDCEPAQEHHRSRSKNAQHAGSARCRAQPPSHESDHDGDGDQGSSPQEGRTRQCAPASSLDTGPHEAQGARANLKDILAKAQASPGCQGLPGVPSPPPTQSGAHPKRRGHRRGIQDCPAPVRGEESVLARHARARQGNLSRPSHRAGGKHEADVGAIHARQMQVGAQGRSGEATGILHASTIPPRSRAIKQHELACG